MNPRFATYHIVKLYQSCLWKFDSKEDKNTEHMLSENWLLKQVLRLLLALMLSSSYYYLMVVVNC